MARLNSNGDCSQTTVPANIVHVRSLPAEASAPASQKQPADVRSALEGSLKQGFERVLCNSLLKAQYERDHALEPGSSSQNNIVRATPKRAVKGAVNYGFACASPPGSTGKPHDNEWAESVEELEISKVREKENHFWDPLVLPVKYQHSPTRQDTYGLQSLKTRGNMIDLTSPEKHTQPSVRVSNAGVAVHDMSRGGYISSSDSDAAAIIRFSPPRLKSPSKRLPQKSTTPPQSPCKSKLNSPQKLQSKIPPTPHRSSIDAFWSQEVVNTWNEQFSPRKLLKSPRKIPVPDSDAEDNDDALVFGSPRKSPSKALLKSLPKTDKSAAAARKTFEEEKHKIAEDFLQEVDQKIGGGEIGRLSESTGGIKLIWSKKLNSTAGRANWKREAIKTRGNDGEILETNYRHLASIELAEKVIDDEHRLLNVLAHEYCHLANFMISNVRDQPHGASFKSWAAKVSREFRYRNIEVTTKHTYEIKYKYAWVCTDEERCGVEYQRHSKSIDPLRHTCGKCKGRLRQVRPVPRKVRGGNDKTGTGGDGGCDGKSDYQRFVKEHFGKVREDLGPKSPMKDVMKELGARYRSNKEETSKKVTVAKETSYDTGTIEVVEILDTDEEADPSQDSEEGERQEGEVDGVSRVLDFLTIHDE